MLDRIGFKKLRWNASKKLDCGIHKNEWYISALLEKAMKSGCGISIGIYTSELHNVFNLFNHLNHHRPVESRCKVYGLTIIDLMNINPCKEYYQKQNGTANYNFNHNTTS
ncbi:hypothetical protein CFP56_010724 [Quercus suber]|uniref:Uncharacterized protein n=1 Tax=Quercus suber TaxID=58331 RepID=A0AAW0L0T5_QUESU